MSWRASAKQREHVCISRGNTKIGKTANVSLPPIVTCVPGVPCTKKCYALKAYRMYPDVRAAWDGNLRILRRARGRFFAEIGSYLGRKAPQYFRWHVAGEIVDQDYYERMKKLARLFPDTKFRVFTKRFSLDFRGRPRNLSVGLSMWPGMKLPRKALPKAWMQDGTETRIPRDAIECPKDCSSCRVCWELHELKRDVWFHEH